MRIAVTGATGYIGRTVIRLAIKRGYDVVALSRRPAALPGVKFVPYDLHEDLPIDALQGCSALIHLAANTTLEAAADPEFELKAAARLIESCRLHGTHVVFVSSQAARVDAASSYGRVKWNVEQIVMDGAGAIVRPGLVYGGEELGLFGKLCGLVRRMPILPALLPPASVQPVHVEDLAAVLLKAAELRSRDIWNIGREQPISFNCFLRVMARVRVRRRRSFLPFPVGLVLALESTLARLGSPALRQLRSLYATHQMPTREGLTAAGTTLRPLHVGMSRGTNGRRRALLAESSTLLSYVLRSRPPTSLMRRYVRAVESLGEGTPLNLPPICEALPLLIAILDGPSLRHTVLSARLSWAVRIAEAAPIGSRRFQPASQAYRPVHALLFAARAALGEALGRLLRYAFSGTVRRVIRSLEHAP